jgi:hypothetical protein
MRKAKADVGMRILKSRMASVAPCMILIKGGLDC